VNAAADLGDDVVLGDRVLVDRDASVTRSVVFPDTYIGEAVHVADAIVAGGLLINVERGSVTHVSDAFLLADISRPPLASSAGSIVNRAAGVAVLLASGPLWPLALAWAVALHPRRPVRAGRLLGNRRSPGPDGAPKPRDFATTELNVGSPLLRHLPRIWAVVTGDLRLIGVSPLPPTVAGARDDEWERVRDEAPAGLIGPGQLAGWCSIEERYLLEAIYARTRTPRQDLLWLARGLRALVGARAWRLAGDAA
jgi:hypothetical protein